MNTVHVSDVWVRGSPYEQYIGRWSRQIAPLYLAWLDQPAGKRWLDVGCGTGALAAAILDHCAPSTVVSGFARREPTHPGVIHRVDPPGRRRALIGESPERTRCRRFKGGPLAVQAGLVAPVWLAALRSQTACPHQASVPPRWPLRHRLREQAASDAVAVDAVPPPDIDTGAFIAPAARVRLHGCPRSGCPDRKLPPAPARRRSAAGLPSPARHPRRACGPCRCSR